MARDRRRISAPTGRIQLAGLWHRRCRFLWRFSDAGMQRLSPRSDGRRPKSGKARSRGKLGTAGPRALWGFVRGVRLRKFEEWRPRMRAQLKRFGTIDA